MMLWRKFFKQSGAEGGKARAANFSAEEGSTIATKAVAAREAKTEGEE
jgi:hypothetical protein